MGEYMYQNGINTWFYIGGGYNGVDITWTHSGTVVDVQMFEGGVIDPAFYSTSKRLEMKAEFDSGFTTHGRLFNVGLNSPRPALCQEF